MPDSLFLFINSAKLCLENAMSLVVGSQGVILHPYKERPLLELQTLQKKYPLIVVLQSTVINAHFISLPTLKKAELMLPNIIEESLLTDIEEMHFVLNKTPIKDKVHLVYSIRKCDLKKIISTLKDPLLTPQIITCDLLPSLKDTLLIGEHYLQLINESACGALSLNVLTALPDTLLSQKNVFLFNNSKDHLKTTNFSHPPTIKNESYQVFIAKEQLKNPTLNMLQGLYKQTNKKTKIKSSLSLLLLVLSFLFFIGTNIKEYKNTNEKLELLKKENFSLYKKIFPDASSMISPRFRVERWLQENASHADQPFFILLHKTSKLLFEPKELTLLSITFQNKKLTLTFKLKNFEALNQLQKKFEDQLITVNQLSAVTEHNEVNAVWGISL